MGRKAKGDKDMIRSRYKNREEWLQARKSGIGASDAAAILEISPWVSKTQLWEEKTGRRKPKDLSGNPAVQRGIREEPIIREQFIHDHPEFLVDHHEFDILSLDLKPFIKATLDGELLYMGPPDKSRGLMPGMRGVLEIKTGSYSTQKYLDKWTGTVVPEFYFAQVCQQLLVTGYDFAWVQAKLFRTDATYSRGDNSHLPETYEKSFFISRQDPSVIQSLPVIEDAHTEFWACVTENRMPWSTIR